VWLIYLQWHLGAHLTVESLHCDIGAHLRCPPTPAACASRCMSATRSLLLRWTLVSVSSSSSSSSLLLLAPAAAEEPSGPSSGIPRLVAATHGGTRQSACVLVFQAYAGSALSRTHARTHTHALSLSLSLSLSLIASR
jgi:hypothetical protein